LERGNFDFRDDDARRVLKILEADGCINDENSQLGSAIKHFKAEIEAKLREVGYSGSKLVSGGHFYPAHGAVYWLYNPDVLSHEEARKNADRWVKNYK
tara:strand:- start:159 stop:452 length:294 start_codon:yes stop_codon:yes gene_type:complete